MAFLFEDFILVASKRRAKVRMLQSLILPGIYRLINSAFFSGELTARRRKSFLRATNLQQIAPMDGPGYFYKVFSGLDSSGKLKGGPRMPDR